MLVPLSFVMLIKAIKDFIEDYKRQQSDRRENEENFEVFKDGKYIKIQAKNITRGSVVKIKRDQQLPCDCVLLYSSDQETQGAFIETRNIDGESNLKSKQALRHRVDKDQLIRESYFGSLFGY